MPAGRAAPTHTRGARGRPFGAAPWRRGARFAILSTMRFFKASLLALSSILAACSTTAQGGNSTANGSTGPGSSASGTGVSDTSTQVTTSGTTGDDGATEVTTSGAVGTTGGTGHETGPWTSTDPTTGTGGTASTTGHTSEPGTTETTSTSGTGTTTGEQLDAACEVDDDCKLHDDCCSCYGLPKDEEGEICDLLCATSKCDELGIEKAVCRFGQCTTEKLDCSSPVDCKALPPECPRGTLPGVADGCWTGSCVPAAACDKVPDCALCPDSTMCVQNQAWVTEQTCEPIPAGCQGAPSCGCAGEACVDPFTLCQEGMDTADLICSCPNC